MSCGKAKLDRPAPACELYTGNLFQGTRRHVEAAGYDRWFILSALHGLVEPDTVLEPYDVRLPKRTEDRQRWARQVEYRLRITHELHAYPGEVDIDLFAGADYTEPLRWVYEQRPHFPRRNIQLHEPLRGLEVGERLHWLKERRAAA